ncbi:MAG TPA: cupredoxin domain-containing protein [Paenibacillus sp.]|uniref:cupredoxin domain-containing protein n=1 Tax=Paenibacillus sp. TaxID=58172 RepID=UPI002CD7CEE2|nr:cupredoxin domain-containing protein [Paenibacillus sp.]HUC91792.1 cupredoxin domain-containing protein [Paenibacillus sp.]
MSPLAITGLGYIVLILWNIIVIFRYRKNIPCMTGMMCSMVLGMISGWGIGSVLSVSFPEQLLQVTFISMLLGGMTGVVSGMAIGIMPVLDGLLAGFMGGMMGPMMMGMFPAFAGEAAVKLTAVLLQGALFLLFLMLGNELAPHLAKTGQASYMKPFYLFLTWAALIGMLFIVETEESATAEKMQRIQNLQTASHQHEQAAGSDSSGAMRSVRIEAADFSFSPAAIDLVSNEKLAITLVNTGTVEHDFEIEGTGIHIHAKPGETVRQVVELSNTGTYRSVCTLPGHLEAGMTAVVKVNTPLS